MHDILIWLIGVEQTAADIYEAAADFFAGDENFSRLLMQMSSEEQDHVNLFRRVSSLIAEDEIKRASFYFDAGYRNKIEAPFTRAADLLQEGTLNKTAMLEVLVDAEFSEWNEILLYILDRLNISDVEVHQLLSDIELHRRHVEVYLASLPSGDSYLKRIRKASQTSGKHILIVDNNFSVALMLKALVADYGEVFIARDGQEGIMKIRQKHFDLVVSDVEMPQMDGIEMYKQALDIDPSMNRKFLFFTGTDNREYLDIIKAFQIEMLAKPSPVKQISLKLVEMLQLATPGQGSTIH